MHYSVRNLDTDEEHELKNIPAVLAFINANRKDKSKRNLGAKKFKTVMSGNGVFENHFKITKVYNKRSGKKSAKPVELAAPPAAAMPSPPMSDKPLPFKTRKSQKSNSGKAPMKEVLQAEETDVVMSEAPTANVDKLTTGDADPEGEESNPVLKPQDKKKRKITPRQARNMKIGRASKKIESFLNRRMNANGKFDTTMIMKNVEAMQREMKSMPAADIVMALNKVANMHKVSIMDVIERVVSTNSHPEARDQSGIRTGDAPPTYEQATAGAATIRLVNREQPRTPGELKVSPRFQNQLSSVLGKMKEFFDPSEVPRATNYPAPREAMKELGGRLLGAVSSSSDSSNLDAFFTPGANIRDDTKDDAKPFAGAPEDIVQQFEDMVAEAEQVTREMSADTSGDDDAPETPVTNLGERMEAAADDGGVEEEKAEEPQRETRSSLATPEGFMASMLRQAMRDESMDLRNKVLASGVTEKLLDKFMRASEMKPGGDTNPFDRSGLKQVVAEELESTQQFSPSKSSKQASSKLRNIWAKLLQVMENFESQRRKALEDPEDEKWNLFKSFVGKGEEEEDEEDEDTGPVNPTSGEVMEVTGDAADNEADPELQPNVAHKLNAFNISQLGENTPEEYYLMRARLGTPMELTLYAPLIREFALNLLTKPLAKAKVNAMLREVASQNVDDSSMYVKYLNHLLFFLFENKVKLPANELEEIENDFGSQYQAFFGQRSESRDNAITSHIRMVVNEGTQMQIDEEPMVQEQLLEGSGALDFLQEWEKGLSTIVRSTIGQEIEKEVVAMQRMSRTHRRGHVLFDNGGSNAVRKGHYAPFKTPIDPSLRRPELAFQSPPSYTKRVPRIAYRNVGGPKRVQVPVATMTSVGDQRAPLEIPSQHPSGRPWASSKEQEDWYRNEAAKNDLGRSKKGETINSYRELANRAGLASRNIRGSGAVQQSLFRRKRGIALYAEEGNERQAHKRLRKAFTLSMYNEK